MRRKSKGRTVPTNKDFEELFTNKCEGFKECLDRSPDVDLEECQECIVEALGEVFSVFVNDPKDIE